MLRTRQIIAVITGVLGVLLIARGAIGGLWPPSIQFLAGILLVVVAVLRWRSMI